MAQLIVALDYTNAEDALATAGGRPRRTPAGLPNLDEGRP